MKKSSVLALILVCCLLMAAVMPGTAFAASTKYIRNPSGRKVNIRLGPGKGWAVCAQLVPGSKVSVVGKEGKWSEITSPVYGYVMTEYLTDNAPKSSSSASSSGKATKTRYIKSPNGKKVNARTGPGSSGYAVAAQLEPGKRVTLVSTKNGWSCIICDGHTVYVMSKYLTSYAPGTEPTKEPSSTTTKTSFSAKIVSANGKKVNMRTRPAQDAGRITQLEPGTSVKVIGSSGSWYEVEYSGTTGYIMKKYVK